MWLTYLFHELVCKSLSTDFKWLALRLGLGILCMITNSAFLISEKQKNKTLFNKNYPHVTLFYFYFSGLWKEKYIRKLTFYSVHY